MDVRPTIAAIKFSPKQRREVLQVILGSRLLLHICAGDSVGQRKSITCWSRTQVVGCGDESLRIKSRDCSGDSGAVLLTWYSKRLTPVRVTPLQRRRELDAELERSQADRKTLLARLQVRHQALPSMLTSQ